jgi:uncharacterized protein YkwD
MGTESPTPPPAATSVRAAPTSNELKVEVGTNTRSPNPRPPSEELRPIESLCGQVDLRLDAVARALLGFRPLGQEANDIDRLIFALRAAGTPYVRPVTWSQSWKTAAPPKMETLEATLQTWLLSLEPAPLRRCGVALGADGENTRLVVVAAQALAELSHPLATTVRVGQWLDFRAELLTPAEQSRVLLVGPEGEPQVVPTSQLGSQVFSRFAARSPGRWLVQLLASTETGPRPMLEAIIYAEVPQERQFVTEAAPGEATVGSDGSEATRLDRLVTATRAETGRPAMSHDPRLDRLATEHAVSMRRAQRVGHDVGTGSTRERLTRAGAQAHLSGENVVHARDALRAHRALWASPSHRTNLLHRGFSRWGLGVVTDVDGSLWVCEIFVGGD